jgi:hypothetical protein
LKQRQLNLIDIRNGTLKNKIAIKPLVENKIFDFSHLLDNNSTLRLKKESLGSNKTDSKPSVPVILPHGKKRKLNKLLREPKNFIVDMFKNITTVQRESRK